jgi:hypothetical protein
MKNLATLLTVPLEMKADRTDSFSTLSPRKKLLALADNFFRRKTGRGCQMVYNPKLGRFLEGLGLENAGFIKWPFGIFYGIRNLFGHFGMFFLFLFKLYKEKSGNP